MGFTYHYFTERKIEEIKSYNDILRDTTIDSETISLIQKERLAVIKKSRAFATGISATEQANSFLFHFSYSWLLVLIAILFYPLLRHTNPHDPVSTTILQTICIVFIFGITIYILHVGASAISMYVHGFYLYFLGLIIQIIAIAIIFNVANKLTKAK